MIRYDNTAAVKLQSELAQFNFKKSKAPAPSLRAFKRRLVKFSAQWITDIKTEKVVSMLKTPTTDALLAYGVKRGFLRTEDEGGRVGYYFTEQKGAEILEALKLSTCAFSGKSI